MVHEAEARQVDAAVRSKSTFTGTFVRIARLAGTRFGVIINLHRQQVDFGKRVVTVGDSYTASGIGRQNPLSKDLFEVLGHHAF